MTGCPGRHSRPHSPHPRGIIKGYVYSIAQPQPLVQDLEHWAPEMAEATTAYGLIGDNWYVFVVRH